MVRKIMEWLSITSLLMVVSWRPFASYLLDFVVCGAPSWRPGLILHQTWNRDSL
jgi:hypothetical protein